MSMVSIQYSIFKIIAAGGTIIIELKNRKYTRTIWYEVRQGEQHVASAENIAKGQMIMCGYGIIIIILVFHHLVEQNLIQAGDY